jgi:DNA repair exonuclease SbcCD ATPase subunit
MKRMKCSECGFFLTTRSFLCPDCGRATVKLFEESFVYKTVVVFLVLVLYGYGTYIVFANKSGKDPEVAVGLGVILVFTITASVVVYLIKRLLPKYKKKTLSNMEEKIKKRMTELENATEKIGEIDQLLESCENNLGHIAKETLENANTSLNHLRIEYKSKLCEIEILRLLNRFDWIRNPLAYDPVHGLNAGLQEINTLEQDCMQMEERWKTELQNSTSRSNECFSKLSQIPDLLNGLREALIAGQIRKAVEEIRPLRSFNGLEGLQPHFQHQISFQDRLNALSTELQVLENENIRLKTEQEVLNTISEKT